MGIYLSFENADIYRKALSEKYRICGPKRMGKYIRYGELNSMKELVYDQKSDFSPKEIYYPVVQTLLYFTENQCRESELKDDREILLFVRACDIHGLARTDQMFLRNGGQADNFYERLRSKVRLILMECTQSFETCFCVAMGTNKSEDYDGAVRFDGGGMELCLKNEGLRRDLKALCTPEGGADTKIVEDFIPAYVKENTNKVRVPDITDRGLVKDIHALPMWREFDEACISCGGCNTVCPTCTCFDTADVIYDETSRDGERRRIWSSCMLEGFTTMAGGHSVRSLPGDKMRFKTMHKIYDYKLRFGGEHMCVGCGRCDMRCPKDIHFSQTINKLAAAVELLKEQHRKGE